MQQFLIVFLLLVAGCSSPLPPTADNADKHFRHSEELRSVMRRMDGLVHERQLTAGEIRRLRTQQATALSEVALELQRVTDALLLEPGSLDAAQRKEFGAFAAALVTEAGKARTAAASGDERLLDVAFTGIETACSNCHLRYRAR